MTATPRVSAGQLTRACAPEVMPRRWTLLMGLPLMALAVTLSGCVSVGLGSDGPAHAYHRLHDDAAATTPRRSEPLLDALLIQPVPADAMADSVSLPYSRQPNEFAFYQFASWTERPVRQVPRLLQQRLEARGVARAVGLLGDPVRADWLLTLRVESLHHDVASPPGQADAAFTVELFDRRSRQRVARQRFETRLPTERADSAAAAAALSQAVSRNFDALLPWLEAELQRQVGAAPAPAPTAAPAGPAPRQ